MFQRAALKHRNMIDFTKGHLLSDFTNRLSIRLYLFYGMRPSTHGASIDGNGGSKGGACKFARTRLSKVLLVQLSDVHFGPELFPSSNGSNPIPGSPRPARMPGMSPHDFGACQDLENELLRLRMQTGVERLAVLVTGDLTVSGDASEFALAQSYIRGRIRTLWSNAIGLGKVADVVVMIPGNHDHLGGRFLRTIVRQRPSAPAYQFFHPTHSTNHSWWNLHEIRTSDLCIQIGGLDSCGSQTPQFAARGSVDPGAIRELEQAMLTSGPVGLHRTLVRILLLHHSLQSGASGGIKAAVHALDTASQQLVHSFCNNTNTRFVLTGHEHSPLLPTQSPAALGTEIRCGSSLQEGGHNGHGQVFLVHAVSGGQKPCWETLAYQRAPQRSFVPVRQLVYRSDL